MKVELLHKQVEELHQKIDQARFQARKLTKQGNKTMATAAWDEVEKLLGFSAHQHLPESGFIRYCQVNPWAPECRLYDI